MTLEKLVKYLGFISLLAGLARMGMTPSGLIWGLDSTPELFCAFIASILMSISSMALFMSQSRETGVFGFIAGLLLSVGNLMLAGIFYGKFAYGDYPDDSLFVGLSNSLSYGGLLLGTIILMVVTFRGKVFPRWFIAVFLCMIASLGIPFLGDFFAFFWGLTYVVMGFTIFTGKYNSIKSVKDNSLSA